MILLGLNNKKPNKIITFLGEEGEWWKLLPNLKSQNKSNKICGRFESV